MTGKLGNLMENLEFHWNNWKVYWKMYCKFQVLYEIIGMLSNF